MHSALLQGASFVAFIVSSLLLVAILLRRPVKRWYIQRRAALKDAKVFKIKYGPEAKDYVRQRLATEPDPGRERHLRRVLRLISRA